MNLRILLVEDDPTHKMILVNTLNLYGDNEIDVVESYQEALELLSCELFDVVIIDIFIAGNKTGVALGQYIKQKYGIPFIYISSNLNQHLHEIMKDTGPSAIISKPIEAESFISNIKLAVHHNKKEENKQSNISDRIFIKKDGIFDKILLEEITYVESDHVYLKIFTKDGARITVRGRLKDFLTRFPNTFFQINRGCVINQTYIDHFDKHHITVNNRILNIGRKFKDEVFANFVSF